MSTKPQLNLVKQTSNVSWDNFRLDKKVFFVSREWIVWNVMLESFKQKISALFREISVVSFQVEIKVKLWCYKL